MGACHFVDPPAFNLRGDVVVELQPVLPPVGNDVGMVDDDLSGLGPVPPPPLWGVKRAEVPLPVRLEPLGYGVAEFAGQCRHDRAEASARFQKLDEVTEVEVGGSEVLVGVEADNGIEELPGEGECVGLGVDRGHETVDAGVDDSFLIVRRFDPQVGCPDTSAEFLGEEDRAHRSAAPQVEDLHSGLDWHDLSERLGQPEGVGAHLVGGDPVGVVAVGADITWMMKRTRGSHCDCCFEGRFRDSQPTTCCDDIALV